MGEEVITNQMTKIPLLVENNSKPLHFMLVHGVSHGAWCWYKVRTLLESFGHTVMCLDLKSAGVDRTNVDRIVSFEDYNKPLVDALSSLPPQQKVILVGHSAGGMSVTDAIYKFPQKIHLAIYVCATMLQFGFQLPQDALDGAPTLSEWDEPFDFGYGLGVDQRPTNGIIKQHLQREILYQMSPIEDCTLARMLLRPFPMDIMQIKMGKGEESSNENESVPRIYIKTLQDKVLKPLQQDAMIKRWTPSKVYEIDTDHSPFFSTPLLLVAFLLKVVDSLE